jgi:oxalate---CoA ligase
LFITGRLKEIINRGGEKIAPCEVDEVLLTHPCVAEAITFAVPHRTLGEDVAAAVVLRDKTAVTASEIRSFAARQLADFKVPRQVLILKDIPKGPTGKPQRIGLAEKLRLTALDRAMTDVEADSTAPRTPVEETLARIWTELLGLEQIGVHDNFFQSGGNSLLAVHLFVQIEKTYGRHLPVATILQAQTIAEQARMLGQEQGSTTWPSLVAIQPGGFRPPFFCIHAHDGHVVYFRHLAFHLGRDQPLYGLQADGQQPRHASVEEMAAHYLHEVRQLQPEGPYFLGGFCFGGYVAFEMAQQLHVQGQRVALLALISTHAPGCHEASPHATSLAQARRLVQKLHELLIDLALLGPQERLAHLREEAQQLFRNRIEPAIRKIADSLCVGSRYAGPRSLGEVPVTDARPLRDYVPTPYTGRVTLFRPRQQAAGAVHDPQFGWGRLAARGVEVHPIPGYRLIMHEPRVRPLAERLRSCLQRARTMARTTRT